MGLLKLLGRLMYGEEVSLKKKRKEEKVESKLEVLDVFEEDEYPLVTANYTIDINSRETIYVEYMLDDGEEQDNGLVDITYERKDKGVVKSIIVYDCSQAFDYLLVFLKDPSKLRYGTKTPLYDVVDEVDYEYKEYLRKEKNEDGEDVLYLGDEGNEGNSEIPLNKRTVKALILALSNIESLLEGFGEE